MSALPANAALPPDVTYIGLKSALDWRVVVMPQGVDLPPRTDLRNHSPTGFAWGYSGSGPAQLALALMAHATGDDALALRVYQAFKEHKVASWARDTGWRMTADEVRQWATTIETARQAHV